MELKDCLLTDEEKIQANNYSTIGEEYSGYCEAQLSKVLKHLPELEEVKKLVDAAVKAEQERILGIMKNLGWEKEADKLAFYFYGEQHYLKSEKLDSEVKE